jgi:hypothetical protein
VKPNLVILVIINLVDRIKQPQRTGPTVEFSKVAAEIPEKSKPDASNHEGKYPTRDTSVTFTRCRGNLV